MQRNPQPLKGVVPLQVVEQELLRAVPLQVANREIPPQTRRRLQFLGRSPTGGLGVEEAGEGVAAESSREISCSADVFRRE